MEANLEETISLDDLAHYVGVSRRQLERLFQKHLKCVPSRYYLELRLNRARQLLLQTNLSIIDVSLACGFVSAPHFSKCYRDFFGIPPREERRRFSPGQSVRAAEESLNKSNQSHAEKLALEGILEKAEEGINQSMNADTQGILPDQ